MLTSANLFLENLIRFFWFILVFIIIWLVYILNKRKIEEAQKDIELQKAKEHEKLNQLSDVDLVKLVNESNKHRPGSPDDSGEK